MPKSKLPSKELMEGIVTILFVSALFWFFHNVPDSDHDTHGLTQVQIDKCKRQVHDRVSPSLGGCYSSERAGFEEKWQEYLKTHPGEGKGVDPDDVGYIYNYLLEHDPKFAVGNVTAGSLQRNGNGKHQQNLPSKYVYCPVIIARSGGGVITEGDLLVRNAASVSAEIVAKVPCGDPVLPIEALPLKLPNNTVWWRVKTHDGKVGYAVLQWTRDTYDDAISDLRKYIAENQDDPDSTEARSQLQEIERRHARVLR